MKIIDSPKHWRGKALGFRWSPSKGADEGIESGEPAKKDRPPGRTRLQRLDSGRKTAFVTGCLVLVDNLLVGDAVYGAHRL